MDLVTTFRGLDRNQSLDERIATLVDDAETALSDLVEDLVLADLLGIGQRHAVLSCSE